MNMTANAFPATGFSAFLFDMDGTILTSILATERVWAGWMRGHGLDVAALLPTIHGMRAIDTMRRLAVPGMDPEVEARRLLALEMEDVGGIEPIRGAAAFLATLPQDRWAVVTSAPKALALRRMEAAGLTRAARHGDRRGRLAGQTGARLFLLGAERLRVTAEVLPDFRGRTGRNSRRGGRRRARHGGDRDP